MQFSTIWPPNMVFGAGASKELGSRAKGMGTKRALIVTDKGLVACGLAERIAEALGKAGVQSQIFGEVQPNPTMTEVRRGVELWKEGAFDLLVALGGGSSIDAAKVIAAQLLTGRGIEDLVAKGVDDAKGTPVPFVVIPTTSGTGSEATSAAMVKDDAGRKYLVRSFRCRPSVSILDPELTLSVPARMTAATGMDAFIHSLGAYTNVSVHPLADCMALEAMRLVAENLPRAVEQGQDLDARSNMMLASHLSGIAISCKGNDAIHGLSTPVESLIDCTHGESLSAILPHVVRYNLPAAASKYVQVARAMGAKTDGLSDDIAARKGVDAIVALRDRVGVSRKLSDVGVRPDMIEELSNLAVASRSTQLNCRKISKPEATDLYRQMI